MLKVLYALALFSIFIVSCHCAKGEADYIHELDDDPNFSLFKDESLGKKYFDALKKIIKFIKEHKRAIEMVVTLATLPFIYEEELLLTYDLIVASIEEEGLIEGLETLLSGAWQKIKEAFQLIKTALTFCKDSFRAVLNPLRNVEITEEAARTALLGLVDTVYDGLAKIVEMLMDPDLLIHLIPDKVLSVKSLVSLFSGVIIAIIEALGSNKDTCKLQMNIKDYSQAYLLERSKFIRTDSAGEQDSHAACEQLQVILRTKAGEKCPRYEMNENKCTIMNKSQYDYNNFKTTKKVIVRDLFLSPNKVFIGEGNECIYYHICRVRENLEQAFLKIHSLTTVTQKKCKDGKPEGNRHIFSNIYLCYI